MLFQLLFPRKQARVGCTGIVAIDTVIEDGRRAYDARKQVINEARADAAVALRDLSLRLADNRRDRAGDLLIVAQRYARQQIVHGQRPEISTDSADIVVELIGHAFRAACRINAIIERRKEFPSLDLGQFYVRDKVADYAIGTLSDAYLCLDA